LKSGKKLNAKDASVQMERLENSDVMFTIQMAVNLVRDS
jgi:hypothetical protein